MGEILPLLFSASGLGMIVWCQVRKSKVRQSESWVPVPAKITRSELRRQRSHNNTIYSASIEYRYEVSGSDFTSERICVGGDLNTSMKGRAERRCRRYPVGAEVYAYYDPGEPSRACLERTAEGTQLFSAIGGGAILIGLLMHLGVIGGTHFSG